MRGEPIILNMTVETGADDVLDQIPVDLLVRHVLFGHLDEFIDEMIEDMNRSPNCFEVEQATRILNKMPALRAALERVQLEGER